jgi:uncharacterized membrane protein YccC
MHCPIWRCRRRWPPLRLELLVALRITVAAGLSAWVAYLAGMPHPAWAAIGAVAVMQGDTCTSP